MNEFHAVETYDTPFARIRISLETIRGSLWSTDVERAREELQKAQREVIAFLKSLRPGTWIRIVPYLNGEIKGLHFLNGQLVHYSVDETGKEISLTVNSEGRAALWKADFPMEKISQISIWEKKE